MQGKKVTLIDEDAYVLGLAYFPSDYERILNAAAVVVAAKGEGNILEVPELGYNGQNAGPPMVSVIERFYCTRLC